MWEGEVAQEEEALQLPGLACMQAPGMQEPLGGFTHTLARTLVLGLLGSQASRVSAGGQA